MSTKYKAILFDLDGTILDSAVHFHTILQKLAQDLDTAPPTLKRVRNWASNGASVMIDKCLNVPKDNSTHQQLCDQFLNLYDKEVLSSCPLFEDVEKTLTGLKEASIPIAIITNKGRRFYQHIEPQIEAFTPITVGITRDDVLNIKPDPEGLLTSSSILNISPKDCLYVGDHKRDIEAAINAKMPSAAACWGYIQPNDTPETWNADHLLKNPTQLFNLI